MHSSILGATVPPTGICHFSLIGGVFPTLWHTERANSPTPGHISFLIEWSGVIVSQAQKDVYDLPLLDPRVKTA